MTTFARKFLAAILALLAPIAAAAAALLTAGSVPDPLPVHWNFAGAVDNTAGTAVFVVATIVIASVLAVTAVVLPRVAASPPAVRLFAAMLTFGAWIVGTLSVITLSLSAGAVAAADVALPWYAIVAVIAVPAAGGVTVWALLPGVWQTATASQPATTLRFAPGERVVWIDHCAATWMRWAAVGAALVAVAVYFLQPVASIPMAVVALAGGTLSELTVRIDDRGMHTLLGPLGWPRTRIALADISGVHSELIEPMQWGGWGYRISQRGTAIVIRRGPGIVVSRSGKPDFAVTSPRAAEGAEVLAALLARARAKRP